MIKLAPQNIAVFGTKGDNVIFLPGNMQSPKSVEPVVSKLSQNFKVHVINMPGNDGNPLHCHYKWEDLAKILHAYITQIGPAHIAASSYSTGIALHYGELFPDHTLSLALSSSAGAIPDNAVTSILKCLVFAKTDINKFADEYTDLLLNPAIPRYRSISRITKAHFKAMTAESLECLYHNSIRLLTLQERPYAINAPTTCFVGALDPFTTPEACRKLADNIGGEFTTIANSDHMLHIETPDETSRLMTQHFTRYSLACAA